MESPELEVPGLPASISPTFTPELGEEFSVQWFPQSADAVVDKGLQFFEAYGLSGPTEGLDFSIFDNLGDASITGFTNEDDEFAQWLSIPN